MRAKLILPRMPKSCEQCGLLLKLNNLCAYCMATGHKIKYSETDLRDGLCPLIECKEDEILDSLKERIKSFKKCVKSENSDYLTGYICALSAVEGMIAEMEKEIKKEKSD